MVRLGLGKTRSSAQIRRNGPRLASGFVRVGYDLVVVGAGTAGISAARTARRRGAGVALVAEGPVGGDCTFVGCVPSKTLIEAAALGADFATAVARVHATVGRVAATESAGVLHREGIDVFDGRARLAGPGRVDVAGRQLNARRLVIATGAGPAVPAIPGLAEVDVLTNENVFDLTARPASLLVIGGGPIGVELAQAFARLGTTVTVIEAASRLLPREEPEASAVIAHALRADGVRMALARQVTSVAADPAGVTPCPGPHTVGSTKRRSRRSPSPPPKWPVPA